MGSVTAYYEEEESDSTSEVAHGHSSWARVCNSSDLLSSIGFITIKD